MKDKKKKKSRFLNVIVIIVFLVGVGIFVYPTFSDMWNKYRNEQLVSSYQLAAEELTDEKKEELRKEAEEYNSQHSVNTIVDAFNEDDEYVLTHPYDTMLDVNGEGLMGSIEIPKLKINLAIYHGLGSDVLEKGVGHVEGTSLPIGGESTHAVLAGHRGLPSAKLFTDLDQIEIGDVFLIKVLDETLAYKVDQIKTVLPEETNELAIIEGEDHVTLVTCTPYGVNTHRLLIRGIRTEYVEQAEEKTAIQKLAHVEPAKIMAVGAIVLAVVIIVIIFVFRKKKGKNSTNKQ